MEPRERERFPSCEAVLKDGRSVTLRFLQGDDGLGLAAFYAGCDEREMRYYYPHALDREHALANAARADSPTEVVLLLVDAAGAVGGYAWYRWREPQAPMSGFGICVAKAFQGCGAGRVLMERLLEVARTVGPPRMRLTCQHANVHAVALYQKLGFRVVRESMVRARRGWPAEPEYHMERPTR